MTPERQEIIKIIEPWMDKTLSFGCLFHEPANGQVATLLFELGWEPTYLYCDDVVATTDHHHPWYWNIIGHYTIDWVNMYIAKTLSRKYTGLYDYGLSIQICDVQKKLIYNISTYQDGEYTWVKSYKIPNKPLINYSVEEERQLLSFLKEIWHHTK